MTRPPEPQTAILDPRYFDHRKSHAVGIHGRELHLRAICFSALHLTDGRLSHEGAVELAASALDSVSGTLVPPSRDDAERLVRSLVAHGLFDETSVGYEIHDWHEFYPSRATVEQRTRWRRKRRGRETVSENGDRPHHEGTVPLTDQIRGSSSVVVQPSASASALARAVTEWDQDPEEPVAGDAAAKGSVSWFAEQLKRSDARTAAAISSVVRRFSLPEAALHAALEIVRERKPRNEAGYFVRVLQGFGEEGRYS